MLRPPLITDVRVAYICDGGGTLGWGHVWRGRAVVHHASAGSRLVVAGGAAELGSWFRANDLMSELVPWVGRDYPLDARNCAFDVIVVDHYTLPPAWIAEAAGHRPTYVVDDWMRRALRATGLINPNVGARAEDYPGVEVRRWLVGERYALIRDDVRGLGREAPLDPEARQVLVTMGGSDPDARTAEIVEELAGLSWYEAGGSITVVLGASYRGARPWEAWPAARSARCTVVTQPKDFLTRCQTADVVVCGASTVSNELAYLGRPFVPVAFVDNQATIAERWGERGVGRSLNVDDPAWRTTLRDHVKELLASFELRRTVARRASALVDGFGAERLIAAFKEAA